MAHRLGDSRVAPSMAGRPITFLLLRSRAVSASPSVAVRRGGVDGGLLLVGSFTALGVEPVRDPDLIHPGTVLRLPSDF